MKRAADAFFTDFFFLYETLCVFYHRIEDLFRECDDFFLLHVFIFFLLRPLPDYIFFFNLFIPRSANSDTANFPCSLISLS